MQNDRFLGNTRYTNQILKLDQAYVHSLCLNYYGDSYVERVHRVLSTPYVKPEFECDLCGAGNHKREIDQQHSYRLKLDMYSLA